MDVARREVHRGLDRLVGIFQTVIILEIRLQTLEDGDGIFNRRLVDIDFLELPHQSAILLEMLPVFLVGGRAHAADRARGQRRLEQVRGVHRSARSGARADDRMNLVDEQDRVRMSLELFQDLL